MYYKERIGVYDTILYRKGRKNRLGWIALIIFGAGGIVVREPGVDGLSVYWAADGDGMIIAMSLYIIRKKNMAYSHDLSIRYTSFKNIITLHWVSDVRSEQISEIDCVLLQIINSCR
jgi:hypothetical protein